MSQQVTDDLRLAYDRAAEERNQKEISAWKQEERHTFLDLLKREGKESLMEIGAGTGHDSLFFQQNGLSVISADLSSEMVRLCRQKGLEAYQMNLFDLDFPASRFDAVYTLNCLLHVSRARLGDALLEIRRVMKPGALIFYGVHGGIEHDGPWKEDAYRPKRHFTLYTDEQLLERVGSIFIVRDFTAIAVPSRKDPELHFQRLILQKSPDIPAQPGT